MAAAGAIGGGVARVFAQEGARLFLAGTDAVQAGGGCAVAGSGASVSVAEVDALDAGSVNAHADSVIAEAGGIDISFNLIAHGDVQGTPMVEMDVEDYLRPVATPCARRSSPPPPQRARCVGSPAAGSFSCSAVLPNPPRGGVHLGGLQTAFHALEAMRRQLSAELGVDGVRVVTLRTERHRRGDPDQSLRERIEPGIVGATLLGPRSDA